MNMESAEILDRPVVSTAIVAVVAALVYVGIQLALDGAVAPVETATFVGIFTAIYVGGNWVLREQILGDADDGPDDDAPVAESADSAE